MKKNKLLFITALLMIFTLSLLSACRPGGTGKTKPTSEEGEQMSNNDYVVYEAVFVDNERIKSIFKEVRGEAPYPKITADYHVTTAFRPDKDVRNFYGKEVTVRITGYKAGDITTDEGGTTQNEGFKVELISDDAELTSYIIGQGKNYHITGSYVDQAKYTGYLDFSDATPLDYTVKGTFGAYLSSGKITFNAEEVGK